MLASTKAIYYQ